jgi:hypothetical protein
MKTNITKNTQRGFIEILFLFACLFFIIIIMGSMHDRADKKALPNKYETVCIVGYTEAIKGKKYATTIVQSEETQIRYYIVRENMGEIGDTFSLDVNHSNEIK